MKLIYHLLKKTRFWSDNYLILREFKHISKIATLAIITTILAALFEGFGIGFLVSFLQSLIEPNAQPIQTGIHWFDVSVLAVNQSSTERLYRIASLILLTTWMRMGLSYLASVCTDITQLNLLHRLRCRIFEQLQSFSLSYYNKIRSGDLINTITTETERLRVAFSGFTALLTASITASVYVIALLCLSWHLTISVIVLFSLIMIGLSALNKYIREFSFEVTKANGQFTTMIVEFIGGIRTVHAFASGDFERRRCYRASSDLVKANVRTSLVGSLFKPLADGLAVTVLVGLIVLAFTRSLSNGTPQVASLLTFFYVLFRLIPLFQLINSVRSQLIVLVGSIDNIKQFLRTNDKPYFRDGTRNFTELRHAIDFVAVDFGYEPEHLILRNITLSLKKGEMTALVGASGAGKTTLADMIARFIDPSQGQILFDGIDSSEFQIESLRRKMAIVSQDTFIFNTSVYDNIAYGSEGASREEVIEAAKLANAWEFIQEMPEGMETLLGDRGVRLSGGQRQRIAIARALLRNPEILILDEATSALDSFSERLIQQSLEKLSVGRTVIAIAHRLSTIASADQVVVLEQGRIVEQGRYQELLERRGKLWSYHQIQYNLNAAK